MEQKPPKIKLLDGFHKRTSEDQYSYLLRLASTMNHAAKLMQDERDKMVKLVETKEQQLEKQKLAMQANNDMVQRIVTQVNDEKQKMFDTIAERNTKIRELEAKLKEQEAGE